MTERCPADAAPVAGPRFGAPDARTGHGTCQACRLRGAELCHAVKEAESPHVRPAKSRRFARDATLVEEHERPRFLGVLRQGYLRHERMMRDGRRSLLALSCPGDLVGAVPGSGRQIGCAIVAATEVEICAFDIETVVRLMQRNRRFRLHVLREAEALHGRQMEMVWRLGALNSRERIIAFLVTSAHVMPTEPLPDGSVLVTMELARRDWADFSNTTLESVSREMSRLARLGLVETVAPGRYRIRDLAFLARLAGLDADAAAFACSSDTSRAAAKSPSYVDGRQCPEGPHSYHRRRLEDDVESIPYPDG